MQPRTLDLTQPLLRASAPSSSIQPQTPKPKDPAETNQDILTTFAIDAKSTNPQNIKPSAPVASIEPNTPTPPPGNTKKNFEIKTDKVQYIDPDYASFDEIKASDWVRAADTENNSLLEWAKQHPQNWIRTPNANTDAELLRAVNGGPDNTSGVAVAVSLFLVLPTAGIYGYAKSRNIKPGEIHFTDNGGVQEIRLTPGIEYLPSPRHSWGATRRNNENLIQEGNVTIARILPDEVGFAIHDGNPVVLLPGRHAYNSPLFKMQDRIKLTDAEKQFQTISLVRVFANELGLAEINGNSILLLPGLHIVNSATFDFKSKLNTKNFLIHKKEANGKNKEEVKQVPPQYLVHEYGTISIMSLDRNQFGTAMIGKEPVILRPGIHIKNNRVFKFHNIIDANSEHIHFNTIHILQVKAGKLGLAWDNNQPILLKQGLYEVSSPTFQFVEFKNEFDELIKHGSITRVRVNAGQLGYAWHNQKPLELKPDLYEFNDPLFNFERHVNAYDELIQFGPITKIRVDAGKIGYAWHKGQLIELQPGLHEYNDPYFKFERSEPANKDVIQFGTLTRIIVKSGEARAIWIDGQLKILREGTHNFDNPRLNISPDPIRLQDVILNLKEIKVRTKDRMPMHVTGQVNYRVKDPEQLIKGIGQASLTTAIESSTDAILRHQVSLADLSIITPDHHSRDDKKNDDPGLAQNIKLFGDKTHGEGDNFRGQLCTQVQAKLSKDTEKWGIEIVEFAIADIGFEDREVEKNLANATAQTRQAEAQFDLQQAQNATDLSRVQAAARQKLIQQQNEAEIASSKNRVEAEAAAFKKTQDASADAKVQEIKNEVSVKQSKAEAEAAALKKIQEAGADAEVQKVKQSILANQARTEAEAAAVKKKLEAEADAKVIEVHAQALIKQAEAERDADIAKAAGKKALAEAQLMLLKDPQYVQLEMMRLQVEMAKYLANSASPAVVFNGEGSSNTSSSMFFGRGPELFNLALQQQGLSIRGNKVGLIPDAKNTGAEPVTLKP